jgi:agmatine deiminase
MPAEWARHEATWLTWPHCNETWPDTDLDALVVPAYVAMVRALMEGETVHIACPNEDRLIDAQKRLASHGIPTGDGTPVRLHLIPTDDEWIRDYGALFVLNASGERRATDWRFNAWGGKYPRTERNNTVPDAMARLHDAPRHAFPIVLEGGSVEMSGDGLCLTTTSCLLNPNRNPDLSQADVEAYLRAGLGAQQTIWLGDGIAGDDTDGHIDDFARFVGSRTVVVAQEPDTSDANHEPLADARARLEAWRGAGGERLDVHPLPMPPPLWHASGERLPASYANFLIANAAVLMPSFGAPQDDVAAAVLERLTGRPVARIPSTDLVWGLGACHCLSQHVPAAG